MIALFFILICTICFVARLLKCYKPRLATKYIVQYTTILILCAQYSILTAQDIHFSNWQMSPLNQNPANTGMYDGDVRLIFNYRNQWQQVKVPYNTMSFGADMNLTKSLIKGTKEAVGIIFNNDVAGDGRYTITDFKVPINHKINFKKDSSLTIAIGILAGISNLGINPDKLSYDKQWDGDVYNSSLSNGETFTKQSKLIADFALGASIQKQFGKKINASIGYALHHLNQPNISFNNTSGVTLKMRHSESMRFNYSFSNISSIMFEYYGNQQQAFKENLVGLSYYYTIQPKTHTRFNVGILTRLNDAVITTVGLEHENIRLQASYDYNYSQFKRATNSRGGFEISLIYIHSKQKLFVPKTKVCPIYM